MGGPTFFLESPGWGLLQVPDLPFWVSVLITLVILDFAIWTQHVMFHAVSDVHGGRKGRLQRLPTWA